MGFGKIAAGACALTLLVASGAAAADKPLFGPPPAWVEVTPFADMPDVTGQPFVVLLNERQARFQGAGHVSYARRVVKILRPEGLRAYSTITQEWRPDSQTVTFNTMRILRGNQVIDLMNPDDITILRRESGLERAMLDGALTATKQVQGLQVGDIIETAGTIETIDPVRKGKSDLGWSIVPSGAAGRVRLRYFWPTSEPMTWFKGEGLPEPAVQTVGDMTQLVIDMDKTDGMVPPNGAPGRFYRWRSLSVTEFKSWNDISSLMAPLYASTAQIKPGSPLAAEVATIKAASRDPKVRTAMALKLTQEKVRYFFLGMGDGGYVPAAAELTWERRFGDCKGKTVLLLAILKELGVEAEPALVLTNSAHNGMDKRVPALTEFNHVLVKARIAGKTYWLDGTRPRESGALDDLAPFSHEFALPVRAAGADLERVEERPLGVAQSEAHAVIDLSQGPEQPAVVTMRMVARGSAAVALQTLVDSAPADALRRTLLQSFTQKVGGITFTDVSWATEAGGDFVITASGKGVLPWSTDPETGSREYIWPADMTTLKPYAARTAGPLAGWPYAVPFPSYNGESVEFILPEGGAGYRAFGPKVKETVGGYEVACEQTATGARPKFRCETRGVVDEITAAEAEAANRRVRQLEQERVRLRIAASPPPKPGS